MSYIIPKYLIDYVKLKRYNKENGITTSISPEELYNITYEDLELLTKLYNLSPSIMYNQPLHYKDKKYMLENHNSNIKPIINSIDKYKQRPCYEIGQIYNEIQNQGKLKNNFFMNNNNNNNNNTYEYNERFDIPRNIKNKSYGYDNPFENYFYYIDNDISLPQHTNILFPESTRLENTINRFNDNFYKK